MTFTYVPEILTHEPYRMVCDDCEWVSPNRAKLSQTARDLTAHQQEAHVRVYVSPPAPTKPSLVLVSGTE